MGAITPERLPGTFTRVTVNPDPTGITLTGAAAQVISPADARAMVFDWTGHDPGPAGPHFKWFAGTWGKRHCRWELGADGQFHLTQDHMAP